MPVSHVLGYVYCLYTLYSSCASESRIRASAREEQVFALASPVYFLSILFISETYSESVLLISSHSLPHTLIISVVQDAGG